MDSKANESQAAPRLSLQWWSEKLGLSRRQLTLDIAAQKLRAIRVGGRTLVLELDMHAYLSTPPWPPRRRTFSTTPAAGPVRHMDETEYSVYRNLAAATCGRVKQRETSMDAIDRSKPFFTRAEYARLWSVSIRTVADWIAADMVRVVRRGRCVRILNDLDELANVPSTVDARQALQPA